MIVDISEIIEGTIHAHGLKAGEGADLPWILKAMVERIFVKLSHRVTEAHTSDLIKDSIQRSEELKIIHKDNMIIYENDEQRVLFSKCFNPHVNVSFIAMTGVSKKHPEGFHNAPVTIIWTEEKWNQLVKELKEME